MFITLKKKMPTSSSKWHPTALATILTLTFLSSTGCQSQPPTMPGVLEPLAIKLYAKTNSRRFTYFKLAIDGQLSFSGGRLAIQHIAKPVGQLTAKQINQLRTIIRENQLLKAPSARWGKKPANVRYEVKIRTASSGSHSFVALDNTVPGVKQLHDTLFNAQALMRYSLEKIQDTPQKKFNE